MCFMLKATLLQVRENEHAISHYWTYVRVTTQEEAAGPSLPTKPSESYVSKSTTK